MAIFNERNAKFFIIVEKDGENKILIILSQIGKRNFAVS